MVSEILGTMLDGESCIHYYEDARKRLLAKNAKIIPNEGTQWVSLIDSPQLKTITQASNFCGLDVSGFNSLRDSVSLEFSRNFGVLLNTLNFTELARFKLYDVNFNKHGLDDVLNDTSYVEADSIATGEGIALMYWWEVYLDEERTIRISTHPNDTKGNIPRDLNWGQGLQLVESPDGWNKKYPSPFMVKKVGQRITLAITCQDNSDFHGRIINVQSSPKQKDNVKASPKSDSAKKDDNEET